MHICGGMIEFIISTRGLRKTIFRFRYSKLNTPQAEIADLRFVIKRLYTTKTL